MTAIGQVKVSGRGGSSSTFTFNSIFPDVPSLAFSFICILGLRCPCCDSVARWVEMDVLSAWPLAHTAPSSILPAQKTAHTHVTRVFSRLLHVTHTHCHVTRVFPRLLPPRQPTVIHHSPSVTSSPSLDASTTDVLASRFSFSSLSSHHTRHLHTTIVTRREQTRTGCLLRGGAEQEG